jgi:hypothetical protein
MCPTDLTALDHARVADAKSSYRHVAEAASTWRELLRSRLLTGAAWIVFALFIYFVMSFRNLLQPAFTTTEAILALVLLGLAIGLS